MRNSKLVKKLVKEKDRLNKLKAKVTDINWFYQTGEQRLTELKAKDSINSAIECLHHAELLLRKIDF